MTTFDSSCINNITAKVNPYTALIAKYYQRVLPMWDEATVAILAHSDLIANSVYALTDVDIAYNSPFYGTIHIWQKILALICVQNFSSTGSSERLLDNNSFGCDTTLRII
jgi:inosine-uridine nucleoside N-ribohydrolase